MFISIIIYLHLMSQTAAPRWYSGSTLSPFLERIDLGWWLTGIRRLAYQVHPFKCFKLHLGCGARRVEIALHQSRNTSLWGTSSYWKLLSTLKLSLTTNIIRLYIYYSITILYIYTHNFDHWTCRKEAHLLFSKLHRFGSLSPRRHPFPSSFSKRQWRIET